MPTVGATSSRYESQAKDAQAMANRARSSENQQAQTTRTHEAANIETRRPHEAVASQPSYRGSESTRAAGYKLTGGPGQALTGATGVGERINVKA